MVIILMLMMMMMMMVKIGDDPIDEHQFLCIANLVFRSCNFGPYGAVIIAPVVLVNCC